MTPRLKISVCTFQGGDFDVMLIDKETGEEVCFSGNQKITDDQLDIVNRLAPACVWTTYYPSEQYKALQARCDKLEAERNQVIQELLEKAEGECRQDPETGIRGERRPGEDPVTYGVRLRDAEGAVGWLKSQMEVSDE